MTDNVLLAANRLCRSYGRVRAITDVGLELRRGEVLGFLGLNGAGKSTTMQVLAGALPADRGSVTICGHDIERAPRAARRQLGYLPQDPPMYDDMRVDEYLAFCARIHGLTRAAMPAAIDRARARCGLGAVGARLIRHLSGGYRQRVALAQAVLHEPAVLILDEPTAGLDPAQIIEVHALLRNIASDHAVMISTHILAEVRALATRAVIMHAGRIVHDAPLREVGMLRVRFVNEPTRDALVTLPGISAAQRDDDGCWLLHGDAAAGAALADHAVRAGWGICELQPGYDELERLFLHLTAGTHDAAAA